MDATRLSPRPSLGPGWIVPATCAIALLRFGRDVLEPLTLAGMLTLVIAPLVRRLRHLGLGRTAATLAGVVLVGCTALAAISVLAYQLAQLAGDLPQYRVAIVAKIEQARERTVRPAERLRSELAALVPLGDEASGRREAADQVSAHNVKRAETMSPPASSTEPVTGLLGSAWRAAGAGGIVLVLLVFSLLDQDGLRDRLLQLADRSELATTLQALLDAANGVSRFFVSQCSVNLCFGIAVGIALWALGLPHAALFGALAGSMRFVPYVGILAAGGLIAGFAAAVDPGWSLMLAAVGLLFLLELGVAYVIEPHVYGHSSGLAPVGIIVSALFWSALWGPVGLVLSTPLTLCLVVAGRHVRALEPITIFFAESPGITRAQRLYHGAFSGDLRELEEDGRDYLRRRSFASYCDHLLLPAAALAAADHRAQRIGGPQLQALRLTLVGLVESLTVAKADRRGVRRKRAATIVEANIGAHLRQMREARLGRWQGPLDGPSAPIVLCASLASERDEFEAELLVRALVDAGVDARSVTLPHQPDPQEAKSGVAERIGMVFASYPEDSTLTEWRRACRELRSRLPRAVLGTVRLPLDLDGPDEKAIQGEVDIVLRSFAEAVAFVQAGTTVSDSPT